MKKLFMTMCLLTVAWMLTGCGHSHDWVEATCSEAKHCKTCGKIEGFPLQHVFKEATCTEPKTCTLCGTTEGEAKGHTWQKRTLDAPKTCSECGATEGEKISVTELKLDYIFDDPTVDSFCCQPETIEYFYNDKDDVCFFDYDGNKVGTVDIVPDGKSYAYSRYAINPPTLSNGSALITLVYLPDGIIRISCYDQFGKVIGQMDVDGFAPEDRLFVRNYSEGHYVRLNKLGHSNGYDVALVIDTDTMTVADNEAGMDSLGKYSTSEYSGSYLQATIGFKYTLVFAKDGSYAGYLDSYGNKVAMYKDATPFNFYGYALVSEDGKTYDIVNDDLEVVGKGVAKGVSAGWAGDAVFYLRQEDGTVRYYSVK